MLFLGACQSLLNSRACQSLGFILVQATSPQRKFQVCACQLLWLVEDHEFTVHKAQPLPALSCMVFLSSSDSIRVPWLWHWELIARAGLFIFRPLQNICRYIWPQNPLLLLMLREYWVCFAVFSSILFKLAVLSWILAVFQGIAC